MSRNSVRARLAGRARNWPWWDTRAHLTGKDNGLIALSPIRERITNFGDLLAAAPEADLFDRLRAAESIGRPPGSVGFLSRIEGVTQRRLVPGKRGPKPMERE